jgi:DNA-binding MarR family transcriptional regulator
VDLAENPAHRRSRLVALTAKGRTLVRAMRARERAALAFLNGAIPPAQLRTATAVLRALRERLQDHSWEAPKARARPGPRRRP